MLRSKFRGTLLGAALGDAIGKCVEDITKEEVYDFYGSRVEGFVEPHPLSPSYGSHPEEISDETKITLILLESVVDKKAIDPQDFYKRLILWREDEKSHRYPDPALLTALDLLSSGISLEEAGFSSASVEGILRCIVVGLFHFYNPLLASEGARLVSIMTHRSPEVYDASAVLAVMISNLIRDAYHLDNLDERVKLLEELKLFVKHDRHKTYLDRVAELLQEGADLERAINTLGNSTYVFESLPLSLFIFLSNIDEPMKALWDAVNSYGDFGGDTDAIGYLVGAYLGAYLGQEIFPLDLVENLENSGYYISLADKLYHVVEEHIERRLQDAL
ncbi:ADP-ribosylation/Crystallin J1 [Hydrogenobacter thermophilus TK-6]|uniref:ADP-ribosylglycohydrolase n=1 Tax=Hydrogenobacter thermophilus (strain DSM 6534 / IAM 12695 / TK-6) TaxID=608538 RepID=D3DGK2_HYDTT|nr:ADP-ribosylglycohydrolase family protein [Hydrogenobacter thermophilus]ADO44889.1 ADP-ribosylation/Crystallin J1 [Hydrogenobacter thermophilus TK-6]BAI68954.1 ADP-ribosylglycohydrolase [Hydrogenobacter thermophilus TK-6]